MKRKKMRLESAKEIIKKSKQALTYYKGKQRQCYLAYKFIIKAYRAYDEKFFYKKLKPYILEEKELKNLLKESWIEENKNKEKKYLLEAEEAERRRFNEFCAGEKDIWENTYGTICPV